jgi:hypothetical protein
VPKKLQSDEKELQAIMDALAESVAEAPDEEILTEVQEEGKNPEEVAKHVKNVLQGAVKAFRQRRLVEAQQRYELHVAAMQRKKYTLPITAPERRELLNVVLSRQPTLRSALTAQYRDFTNLADADVESYLKQLQELEVLDEMLKIEEESE